MIDEKVISPPAYVDTPQPQLVGIGSTIAYPPAAAVSGISGQPQYVASAAEIGAQYQHQLFARCAQGDHDPTTKYGIFGIITAVVFFPIGLICLFSDTETRCARCGIMLHT